MVWLLLFSPSVLSGSLQLRGLQQARLPCRSVSLGVCSDSCARSGWCHPTISLTVTPPPPAFFHLPSIYPSIRVFSDESLLTSSGKSTEASASVLPMNIQCWFSLGWTGLISLQSKGLSRVFSSTTVQKHQFFGAQLSLWSYSYIHTWPLEKP